jgi:hypothetical protein
MGQELVQRIIRLNFGGDATLTKHTHFQNCYLVAQSNDTLTSGLKVELVKEKNAVIMNGVCL